MEDFANYLKKELVRYISHEAEKGIPIERVRKSLLQAGHHHDLVHEAIESLHRHNWDVIKAMEEPIKNKLQQELYFDVVNSIVKYIEYNIAQGKSIAEIENTLLSYGHSHDNIVSAIETVLARQKEQEREETSGIDLQKVAIGIGSAAFLVLLFLLSSSTKASFGRVVLGLMPTLLTLVFSIIFVERIRIRMFLFILPFAFVMIFVFAGAFAGFEIFAGMDIKGLAMLNLIISLFYIALIVAIGPESDDTQMSEEEESKAALA